MLKKRPIIAMDISTTGKGGGPYTSTMNLINSSLKNEYDFQLFEYDTRVGRFVSIKRIKDIASQLRAIKPDIVHFSGLQLSGFHVVLACRLVGIKKSIVVIHGSSTEAMNIGIVKRRIIYLLESLTLALASTFYGVSRYSSLLPLTKPFRKKSSGFVYNLPIMTMIKGAQLTKENLGFKDQDIVVATVARIIKDKGYHIFTQSIKEFGERPNIKFLIIGEGDYLSTMKSELLTQEQCGQVKFLGYRDDVLNILPACDIFVLPTLHETLSIALLEASFHGLPLIASDVGGVPEIITHEINGLLVPPSDPKALTQAISTMAVDHHLRSKMGIEAKKNIDKKFSENLIVKRVDEIYKNLLK